MATGMEALMGSLLKSMGFDPAKLQGDIGAFVSDVYARLEAFDKRMTAQEDILSDIRGLLRILTSNHVDADDTGAIRNVGPIIDAEPARDFGHGAGADHGSGPNYVNGAG